MAGTDGRLTQAGRRARSRAALLEAAARGVSRHGYAALRLEDVAAEAGYTRGALYHQFRDKEELVLAALEWVFGAWEEEVGSALDAGLPPAEALCEMARRHAVFCRRDVAGLGAVLRAEFGARRDRPVAVAVWEQMSANRDRVRRLIVAGRREGTIPPGPPAVALAGAALAAVEGAVIALAGRAPYDEQVAERLVRGLVTGSP